MSDTFGGNPGIEMPGYIQASLRDATRDRVTRIPALKCRATFRRRYATQHVIA